MYVELGRGLLGLFKKCSSSEIHTITGHSSQMTKTNKQTKTQSFNWLIQCNNFGISFQANSQVTLNIKSYKIILSFALITTTEFAEV